jgi:hypothetical protein
MGCMKTNRYLTSFSSWLWHLKIIVASFSLTSVEVAHTFKACNICAKQKRGGECCMGLLIVLRSFSEHQQSDYGYCDYYGDCCV